MKKMLSIIFIILFMPINILAYSNFVIPGGESIGIEIESDGLIVVGFYKVNGSFIGKETFKVGDSIIKVNDNDVYSIKDLTNKINKEDIIDNKVKITIKRNNKEINTTMNVILNDNIYKTGLYIKDSVTGIGTLTYIDPVTKIYGALGHEILLSETNERIEVRNGNILNSKVTNIDRSVNGKVGSKNATINYNNKIGSILKNTEYGIYGVYTLKLPNKSLIEVSSFDSIHKGEAQIKTVTKNNVINTYNINIIDTYSNKMNTTKAFGFEVTDEKLLNETGGIVQGMSGSPIFQDGKLIGAVTNVLVDNVTLGYGIYIKTMLAEGEK